MSSKDKDNTLLKIRSFFKKSGGAVKERELGADLERELRPENPVAQRCKTLKDFGDMVSSTKLEDSAINKLWELTKDLIVDNKSIEHRQTTLTFYRKLIQGQYANLSLMREHFFLIIQKHDVAEDLGHRLDLLIALTENGKDITNFEEKIGKFMLQWAPIMDKSNLTEPYLEMLLNIIKFNAAHLDNEIVVGIVQHACNLSCTVEQAEIGLQCLKVLDAVICYTIFPNETLTPCIYTLCRTVNLVPYCQTSWKNMKMLLCTNLGYESLLIMCNLLKDKNYQDDETLLRGAVFHINMGVFGSSTLAQLPTFSTVLASFLYALDSRKVIVTYEVILSIQMLIPKFGKDLPEYVWDIICDILLSIADNICFFESNGLAKDLVLQKHFHKTIDDVEQMLQKDEICVKSELIYDLIEKIAESRPEMSVLNLIEFRSSKLTATRPEWLQILRSFVQRFYKIQNTEIRIKTIQSLLKIMDMNRAGYEEEILERVIIPEFSNILYENDLNVRKSVGKALIDFAWHCDTKRCGELLDILEKILNRPFEIYGNEGYCFKSESEFLDVLTVVQGLIEVFMVKLYRLPSCHAIRIFNMLVEHLELHYQKPKVFEYYNVIRYTIFEWMLRARANSSFHIGYPDPANKNIIKYSHYLGIDASLPLHDVTFQHQVSTQSNPETIPAANFTTISIRHACKLIVTCIEKEKDFSIFQLVLKELPHILQNKAIIQGNDIESLAQALFTVFSPKKDRKFFQNAKPSSDDFNALVLPAIASLVIYHQYLTSYHQQCIIEALKCGVFQRVANICINTLTIMILEMPETLMRKLPDVLLEMSKMTDTVTVAIPVLEFVSILNRLPNNLFANFVPVQYMYVFAITLPYTKPQRYDHYTVSLAHHVIAGWFLKCKLQFRKNFVTYIIQSIQTNSKLFEDSNKNIRATDFNLLNEDSSNRKRSTSLTERGSRGRGSDNQSADIRSSLMNESLKNFHAELAETCIDFLARHTFSPCSALPKRLPAVEYFLKDGPSQTWLVGQNLITITTNGCASPPTRNGLCDRCSLLDKTGGSQSLLKGDGTPSSFGGGPNSPEIGLASNKTDGAPDFQLNRRYTKASLQYSSGTDSGSTDLTTSSSSSQQHASLDGGIKSLRQTSNSSSGSLEALSRRGSNPDSIDNRESSNSMLGGTSINLLPSATTPPQSGVQQQICARSCTGWAEIFVRRPTGNISWIMRIQNPISNDCLGNDMPFNDLISLFLPVQYGGVFGPDFVAEASRLSTSTVTNFEQCPLYKNKELAIEDLHNQKQNIDGKILNENKHKEAAAKAAVAKVRALKRQEEITSVAASTSASNTQQANTSGPIDIPKMTKVRCNKDPTLAGSFSDLEADDGEDDNSANGNGGEEPGYNEDGVRSRNPVRRVNSSPEMSSSWRNPFMQGKQSIGQKIADTSGQHYDGNSQAEVVLGPMIDDEQQQKKKTCVGGSGFSKDMRVSCEAIPEEIAGSTPPSQSESLKDEKSTGIGAESEKLSDKQQLNLQTPIKENTYEDHNIPEPHEKEPILPPKQHSADDVTNQCYHIPGSSSTTSLKIPVDLQKVTTKPPQSPAPLSPRLLAKNAANKIASFAPNVVGNSGNMNNNSSNMSGNGDNGDMIRGRSKTISVVREVKNNQSAIRTTPTFRQRSTNPPIANSRLGINPSFVFLQLFHTGQLQCIEMPIRVTPENMTALALFDYIPPFETHTISVLYVGPGQCNNEMEILKNRYGSSRYVEFLRNIGTLVSLKDAKDNNLFLNMETNGKDGFFTYVWKDDIVHVTFNVATLMPNLETDRNFTEKKKNIGNNYVSIVYNESGEDYNIQTVKGQFNFACIVVQPLELNTNRVTVKARNEISGLLCHPEPMIVSDRSAPLLARQLALHANLASSVHQSLKTKNPFASNWLERLRKIKNLRQKLLKESQTSNLNDQSEASGSTGGGSGSSGDVSKIQRQNIHDFTKYT